MKFRSLALAAACALLAFPAAAKDELVMVSVDKVLQHWNTPATLNGVAVRFGSPGASYAQGTEIRTHNWARPYHYSRLHNTGFSRRLTNEETCQVALRFTLGNLAQEARRRGAGSVVDIVSLDGPNGKEGGSPTEVQCLATEASATVYLKGRAQ